MSVNRTSAKTILCYVTDRRSLPGASGASGASGAIERAIERAASAGVDWIQVREKDLEARALEALVRRGIEICAGRSRLIVNGRLDVALAAGATGVHLGEASLPVPRVSAWRAAAGRPEFSIGVSCHSQQAAQAAESGGADYVFFGPVFSTPSKASFGEPQGLERLASVCRAVKIPVLAIGGVIESNAENCLAAGAAGIAAIGMFQREGDLAAIVRRLRGPSSAK